MEPFEREELTDHELDGALAQWTAPDAPERLKSAVFGERRAWWRRVWAASIRIPVPVVCAIVGIAAIGAAVWPSPRPEIRVVMKTQRVEVPVMSERVVYRDRPGRKPVQAVWRPVAELRPRILRGANE